MSEHCHICKRKYDFVYSVPDEVWEKISPVPVDGFKSGGLLCIECANTRADENGIILFWSAGVNGYPAADLRERLAELTGTLSAISNDAMSRAGGNLWLLLRRCRRAPRTVSNARSA